jgi:hypothetical protein
VRSYRLAMGATSMQVQMIHGRKAPGGAAGWALGVALALGVGLGVGCGGNVNRDGDMGKARSAAREIQKLKEQVALNGGSCSVACQNVRPICAQADNICELHEAEYPKDAEFRQMCLAAKSDCVKQKATCAGCSETM